MTNYLYHTATPEQATDLQIEQAQKKNSYGITCKSDAL